MSEKNLLIVGGGLAGLSAGCYARANGYATTIIEHGRGLGGVCTAWPREPYVIDGCIHWLTGGPFAQLYEELGIFPRVSVRTLDEWVTWRSLRDGLEISVVRDLRRLAARLRAIAPADGAEIDRLMDAAGKFENLAPPVGRPPEITPVRERLRGLWGMRQSISELVHFESPIDVWARRHLRSEPLRRFFTCIMPPEAPALLLLFVLGYLARGWLSRPSGGTAAFRDALVERYQRLGGRTLLNATVDEILVEGGRARGVRLGDGTVLTGDAVVSTSSMPESVLRLLGGTYDSGTTRRRMQRWKAFQPIVLASFCGDLPLEGVPGMLLLDGLPSYSVGGFDDTHLYLRICNDDPSFAPPGHAVVQAMLATDYEWWASRGAGYHAAKDDVARVALEQIERAIPGVREHVRMTDIATPLTYWREARSWHGAYEGWVPNAASVFGHVKKKLRGLDGFYMAGQWVEPGGGVPVAVMSGRQAVQILCHDDHRPFRPPIPAEHPAAGRERRQVDGGGDGAKAGGGAAQVRG